jgi:hypothetical protein
VIVNKEPYSFCGFIHPWAGKASFTLTSEDLLKAANLAVFELGMWQSWTGR